MRKNWLLVGICLLLSMLAVAAVACDDDDNGDGNGNGAETPPGAGVTRLVATLTEVDGSGASGDAELLVNGEGILVNLTMEGLTEGSHANHLHHGTCEEQGDIHITLDGVVADASGAGSQTTGNDEQPLSHFETGHYLAVHQDDPETIGPVVACGEVVAE